MRTFAVISLGCDKNRVDSERILALLNGSYALDRPENAEIILVNTCAFIERAREEAIDTILEAAAYKRNRCKFLIVAGCLAEKYAAEIEAEMPEVDAVVPIRDYPRLPAIVAALYGERAECGALKGRLLTTPPHYAYLKIADGCDNRCTYCTIPSIRGKYVSTPMDELVAEAESLAKDGVYELILVAQDVTRYGFDLYGEYKLTELVRRLIETDVGKIRLMYCYPELINDELIEMLATQPKLAKYIDIPLQHVDDGVLKRMNRKSTCASIVRLIEKLRAADPSIAIRTTVMVGFPGETEQAYKKLYDFLKTYKLEHVGVFGYSEEDTPSAKLDGKVPEKTKRRRADKIGALHLKITIARNRAAIGSVVRVLSEEIDFDRGMFKGRTERNAPDIDTYVYFTSPFAEAGKVYDVRVTAADGYDLIGEAV